jgi:uncharacterized protein
VIKDIRDLVELACKSENNKFGYGIWSHHIVSVVDYSVQLADKVGADKEVVEIAALLHDYASIKDCAMYKEHHIHGADEAEIILSEYDYPIDKIDCVKECIMSHRGSVLTDKSSPEATCIADADAIAHIVNVPSLLFLTYNQKGMSIDEGKKYVLGKLERSWNKLSELAKELVQSEYEAALLVLR